MKSLVATLLLLFQLQPLAGSVACLLSPERAGGQECEMTKPEQRTAPVSSVLQAGDPGQGCALALACATSAPAVPSLSGGQESIVPAHSATAVAVPVTLTGVASAPPFHPPRA